MNLNGIGALVAGGASGLGEATARALVERGARVAIADLNEERANGLAGELGDAAVAFRCDVTAEADVEAAVAGALEALGDLRLTVSCAGIGGPRGPCRTAGRPSSSRSRR